MFKAMAGSGGISAFRAVAKEEMDVYVHSCPISTVPYALLQQEKRHESGGGDGPWSYPGIGK